MEIVTLTPQQLAGIVAEATAHGVEEGYRRATAASAQPPYLTASEAGAMLGVSAKTARLWVRTRGLPCRRPNGKTPLFLADEVEAWMRTQDS